MTNKQKERYYHEYVPDLLDVSLPFPISSFIMPVEVYMLRELAQSLQALSEARTSTLNKLWSTAASMETDMLTRSTQLLEHLSSEIPRNNPVLDSMMFVRHNASQWQDPPDFAFEPSPVWLDDDVMASDPGSKTFLMNILTKSKSSLGDLRRECDTKRREVEGAKRVRQAIREGRDKRDEVEVVRAQFYHQEALHEAERKMITAEVEVSTITSNVGDVSVGARNHAFKNETFRLPTNCDLCGDRIWGLSAKGLICNDCGFTCHTKCELKVPADCAGELNKEQKKSAKAERQAAAQAQAASPPPTSNGANGGGGARGSMPGLQRSDTMGSMNTLSSGYAASAHRSVSGGGTAADGPAHNPATAAQPRISSSATRPRLVAPPPATYAAAGSNGAADAPVPEEQRGRMLFAYLAAGSGEISVPEGTEFTLAEPDDGSGWIKIRPDAFGAGTGLVPGSYAELSAPIPPSKNTSAYADERPVSTAASASTTSLAGSSDGGGSVMSKKKVGPAVAPRRGGGAAKKVATKYVEALYKYEGANEGETGMEEGERLVLVGADQGDGWCEVEGRAGRGVVPASWVREV